MSLKGTYLARKKDGSKYYRASITYKNKHLSLGSYSNEAIAHTAYNEAYAILFNKLYQYTEYNDRFNLSFNKWIILHNFRDNGYYIKTPIYMHKFYFSYFLTQDIELKFDVDDLFYFSNHKILKRNGYLFVNDYGMQINILSRYGIKNFAVEGKDYYFIDNDSTNLRYHNIIIVNKYYGVEKTIKASKEIYVARIHLNGNYIIGKFTSEIAAAIAYNKAADYINTNAISKKNFQRNYIDSLNTIQYLDWYDKIKIPKKILHLVRY